MTTVTWVLALIGAGFCMAAVTYMLFPVTSFQIVQQNRIILAKGNRGPVYQGLLREHSQKRVMDGRKFMRLAGLFLAVGLLQNAFVASVSSHALAMTLVGMSLATSLAAGFIQTRKGDHTIYLLYLAILAALLEFIYL